jgi:hypothetical protein
MGAAAYQRGSQAISNQIAMDNPVRHTAFEIMDRINAKPKFENGTYSKRIVKAKCIPFSEKLAIQEDDIRKGVWWLMDSEKLGDGFGYHYRSLEDAVRNWDIFLTGYDETTNTWFAE